MHAMATQTIVHQKLALVVVGVKKNVGVTGAVRAGLPIGKFLFVAFLAARHHLEHVLGAQAWLGGSVPAKMREDAAHVVDMESGVEGEDIAMAIGARHVAMRGSMPVGIGLPDFVATGARATMSAFVVGGN